CYVGVLNLGVRVNALGFYLPRLHVLVGLLFCVSWQMESIQQNYKDDLVEHASNGPPGSPDICDIVGAPQLNPRVGEEYQVEVPSMIKESERIQLRMNPADSEVMHDNSLSFAIGLPISVMWMHNEVEDGRSEGHLADIDGTVNAIELVKETTLQKNSISGNE
ncbi:hypothetical protein CR513_60322, partial [Mucuna pruriens]